MDSPDAAADPGREPRRMTRGPAILVLAAGESTRFAQAGGEPANKLEALITVRGQTRTVLAQVVAAATATGLPVHVVQPSSVAGWLPPGMGSSIAAGVQATADAPGWLVLPGDLPLIETASITAVAQALQAHAAVVPVVGGTRGHPVGFGAACREALLALRGDTGAREVLAQVGAHALPLEDPGCVLDVDTPQRLDEARRRAGVRTDGRSGPR
jgi:molybdenum cofactor cytidylyltransferase